MSTHSPVVRTFDEEVALAVRMKPISEVAQTLNLSSQEIFPFGHHVAKIDFAACESRLKNVENGRYIVITGITPTTGGEGKTLNTISACEGMNALLRRNPRPGKRNIATACIRQPSLGPTFGSKGGAAGGGHAQVLPMHTINLGLTHDELVINTAHNMITAALLTELRVSQRDIATDSLDFPSVIPLGDKSLQSITRHITRTKGRGTLDVKLGFHITTASELMAIVALAQNAEDLQSRIKRIVVARDSKGKVITAGDLKIAEAVTGFLWSNQVLFPNLLQTTAGNPAFVHAGPFANIAHGNSSIVADRLALKLSDYVVTEAGFDSSMGFQKFIDIKCRTSGLFPNAAGLVITLKAVKSHDPQGKDWALGLENVAYHIQNIQRYGIPCVAIINPFEGIDTADDLSKLKEAVQGLKPEFVVTNRGYLHGAQGAEELGEALMNACEQSPNPRANFLYTAADSIEQKLNRIVQSYGGKGAKLSDAAREKMKSITASGYDHLPVCMAKTQYSLTDDLKIKGAPQGFEILIRDLTVCAGAGFIRALAGDMNLLPGWGSDAHFRNISFNPTTGEISGVS